MVCMRAIRFAVAAAAVSGSHVPYTDASNLALVQQNAQFVETEVGTVQHEQQPRGIGSTVPLTEKGYQTVASLKDDREMKIFIHRVVEKEARYVQEPAELSGLVPFYSGNHSVQTLDALKAELRGARWVADGEGRNAPLNEEGYQRVAQRRSKAHMMAFARRILDADGLKCHDEGALLGLTPYFDGEVSTQSFVQLKHELVSASWAVRRSGEQHEEKQVAEIGTTGEQLEEKKQDTEAVKSVQSPSYLNLIILDESEVKSRGSHCLDGSTPGYLYKEGTADDKWVFWLQGNVWCKSKEECAEEIIELRKEEEFPIMKLDEFSDYHHVMFERCDAGLYMGDLAEPVYHNGKALYFQGKRIVDHIIDVLKKNTTFGSATEVLLAGGSGGGQSSFIIGDYFASIMPQSVQKFGVVPINGWYANGYYPDEVKSMFDLANMKSAISPACAAAHSDDDAYKCLDPAVVYKYSTSPTFIVQAFDFTFQWNNESSDPTLTAAWTNCLDQPSSSCTSDQVDQLQDHLDTFTQNLQGLPNYYASGHGGFLLTCTEHTFYKEDDLFSQYSNNGVSVGDAVTKWWQSLGGSSSANWYLPCTLGDASSAQCEQSC